MPKYFPTEPDTTGYAYFARSAATDASLAPRAARMGLIACASSAAYNARCAALSLGTGGERRWQLAQILELL